MRGGGGPAASYSDVFCGVFTRGGGGRGGGWRCRGVFFPPQNEALEGGYQAAFRLRNDRAANRAAIFMRLLASTAAATHSSNRSRPSARQRFMPRPRNNTEMRPSIPARKR